MVILLTLLVVYGGAGVNLFTFCCNDCRSEGLTVILNESCYDVHEHHHAIALEQQGGSSCVQSCCASHSDQPLADGEEESCDINRINTQWERAYTLDFDLSPIVLTLPPYLVAQFSGLEEPKVERLCTTHCDHGPPVQTPRSYLSLLTTLLI